MVALATATLQLFVESGVQSSLVCGVHCVQSGVQSSLVCGVHCVFMLLTRNARCQRLLRYTITSMQ